MDFIWKFMFHLSLYLIGKYIHKNKWRRTKCDSYHLKT